VAKYVIELDLSPALGVEALRKFSKRVSKLLMEQTLDRIESGGDDEITFEPLKFDRPNGSRDRPLWGNGSHLHSSITSGVDEDGPWVGSTFEGANVHQFGTVGGSSRDSGSGTLPTIKPKRAKALFIPLTSRAQKSVRTTDMGRVLRKSKRKRKGVMVMEDLKKGEDFIFVSKVDLPPRPFLRVSRRNAEEIGELLAGDD
jgi:phage gpG-like protein